MAKLLQINEQEKFIQINDISAEALSATWAQLVKDYPGYEVFFSYNSERMADGQVVPVGELAEIGAELVDDMLAFRLRFSNFKPITETNLSITPLDEAGFSTFAEFHDQHYPDIYWTSERIAKRLDIWQIFTLKEDGQITGYTMAMVTPNNAEIFAIVPADDLSFKTLLATACNQVFTVEKEEVLYMIDRKAATNQTLAKEVGFEKTGFYQGYRFIL